jgi:prephenate dehydrogenase
MDEAGFYADSLIKRRVAIWGLGLMGGSLAMALRGKCAWIAGIDVDQDVVDLARQRGIVDFSTTHPEEVIGKVDVIILATPVLTIIRLFDFLGQFWPSPAVILDLGSTKRAILKGMDQLPDRFDPVGGHPMCGKEKGTLLNAEAAIYQGAPFALAASQRTSPLAKGLVEEIARAAGANPFWIDAETHDRWVAATSHAPFLIANALAQATPIEAFPLVGPGFRSTARVAGSSSRMMVDILKTNVDYVKEMIADFRIMIERYESLLSQEDYSRLAAELDRGAERYRALVEEH